MDKYRVRISHKNGTEIGVIEGGVIEQMVRYESAETIIGRFFENETGGLDYVVSSEEEATYVYGMLKRFLDLRRYMVTLELPKEERKPKHLGSC